MVVDKISALVVVAADVGNVGFATVCVATDIGELHVVVVEGICDDVGCSSSCCCRSLCGCCWGCSGC